MAAQTIEYHPEPTAHKFHNSRLTFRGLAGPVGTGKTTAIIFEILKLGMEQYVYKGKRSSRVLIVRNTYPELESNVIKEFLEWFPPEMMTVTYKKPISVQIKFRHPVDDTLVHIDISAMGLDHPSSIGKLRGWNGTFAWLNEADLLHVDVFNMVHQRLARWPGNMQGGVKWGGILLDYNMPDISNWVYQMFEVKKFFDKNGNVDSQIFKIPAPFDRKKGKHEGGFVHGEYTYFENPMAEGVKFQPKGFDYWRDYLQNKDDRTIRRFILGQYVNTKDGEPVFESFDPDRHVAPEELMPLPHLPCWAIFDWGHHAACLIMQPDDLGRLRILDEFYKGSIGLTSLLEDEMEPVLRQKYRGITFTHVIGDPTGRADGIQKDLTPYLTVSAFFTKLKYEGVICGKALTNSIQTRYECSDIMMKRPNGMIVSPQCTWLIDGLAGNYRYKPKKNEFGAFESAPDKDDPHCVPTTYEVLTLNGWRNHGEIAVGDEVFGYDINENKLVQEEILEIPTSPDAATIQLIQDGETIMEATEGHRHLVRNHGKRAVLKTTDLLLIDSLVELDQENYTKSRETSLACVTKLQSRSAVFCLRTQSSFWVCRTPAGRVFITGNSHICDTFGYGSVHYLKFGNAEEESSNAPKRNRNNRHQRRPRGR